MRYVDELREGIEARSVSTGPLPFTAKAQDAATALAAAAAAIDALTTALDCAVLNVLDAATPPDRYDVLRSVLEAVDQAQAATAPLWSAIRELEAIAAHVRELLGEDCAQEMAADPDGVPF